MCREQEWDGGKGVAVPYGLEIRHGIAIVLELVFQVDRNGGSVIQAREDIFLAPGRVDVGVLMLATLGAPRVRMVLGLFRHGLLSVNGASILVVSVDGRRVAPFRRHVVCASAVFKAARKFACLL